MASQEHIQQEPTKEDKQAGRIGPLTSSSDSVSPACSLLQDNVAGGGCSRSSRSQLLGCVTASLLPRPTVRRSPVADRLARHDSSPAATSELR